MSRVRIKSNFGQVFGEFAEMAKAFSDHQGIVIRIINEVEYAVFVEYGTSKMDARAMVRRSIPHIMETIEMLWAILPVPFFPDDLETLAELVKDDALEEIRRNTPRRSGKLQEGFTGKVERF